MINIKIIGTGSYLPENIVTNEELAKTSPIDPQWVKENLGISQRHFVTTFGTSILATNAGINALQSARISSEEIDLIIVATATPDFLSPSTACLVQKNLKAINAVAYDISAVCSGFLFGILDAAQWIKSGKIQTALIIGADSFSTITDWDSRNASFFGDGAGAVLIQASKEIHLRGYNINSDGTRWDYFTTKIGGKFTFKPKELYDFGCKVIPESITSALYYSNMNKEDITHIIPHQASIKLLTKLCELCEVPISKLRTNMDRVANTAGATIPILIDELNRNKKFNDGDVLLLTAMGSGMTWGSIVYVW